MTPRRTQAKTPWDNLATLRIYGIDPAQPGSVRIRAYSEDLADLNTVLFDTIVPLTATQLTSDAGYLGPIAVRPLAADLNLDTLILQKHAGVRFEIEPV